MQTNLKLDLIIHFVANPLESAHFYKQLFSQEPIEQSPTFALFELPSGIQLGLWSNKTAEPTVINKPGGSEICFKEENVDAVYEEWLKLDVSIAQPPTDMDFGRTFVALDPDGHRIRVYKLKEGNDA